MRLSFHGMLTLPSVPAHRAPFAPGGRRPTMLPRMLRVQQIRWRRLSPPRTKGCCCTFQGRPLDGHILQHPVQLPLLLLSPRLVHLPPFLGVRTSDWVPCHWRDVAPSARAPRATACSQQPENPRSSIPRSSLEDNIHMKLFHHTSIRYHNHATFVRPPRATIQYEYRTPALYRLRVITQTAGL